MKEKSYMHHNTLKFSLKMPNPLFFEESKLKEYEHINLDKLKSDKEKLERSLKKSFAEIETLKDDFQSAQKRTKERENELRSHIQNLSSKLRISDLDEIKNSMAKLQGNIVKNIQGIQDQTRDKIIMKKQDIEARINLRLVDSEYRYKNVLFEKVNEQKDIIRCLHEHTQEMDRIKENFFKIKKKSEVLTKENDGYKVLIDELEIKNSKLKMELMALKQINNFMQTKMDMQLVKHVKRNSESKKVENNPNTEYVTNKDNIKPIIIQEFNLNDILRLINDPEFLNKNYKLCSAMSSLANIFENTKIRLNKLQKEVNEKEANWEVMNIIYEIIDTFKYQTLTKSLKSVQSSKNLLNSMSSNFGIFMNKDERKQLTYIIVNNPKILSIVFDEKFPNILNAERKLISPK
jgi:hypothetical protein